MAAVMRLSGGKKISYTLNTGIMKMKYGLSAAAALLMLASALPVCGQTQQAPGADQLQKASQWVATLGLTDKARETRVRDLVAWHLYEIREWHNSHPYTSVPAGIDPRSGDRLTPLDRQVIVDASIPDSVHEDLMKGLRAELDSAQVDAILDKYTVGKVAFTMKGYQAIVPDLTPEEHDALLGFLSQARAEAVDYKNMKEISAIFEIYKTKCEGYLNNHDRNWRQLYKAYVDKIKAEKKKGASQS